MHACISSIMIDWLSAMPMREKKKVGKNFNPCSALVLPSHYITEMLEARRWLINHMHGGVASAPHADTKTNKVTD